VARHLHAVTMPKWGIEMRSGTLATWHVEVGQTVRRGDALVDVETDKIVNAVEAPAAGVLHRIHAHKGETISVGGLLAVIGSSDATAAEVDVFIANFRSPLESAETVS
jgi:pyruvate dehydrogenase E2 component (dihydrolipoamide acetyltransferase)